MKPTLAELASTSAKICKGFQIFAQISKSFDYDESTNVVIPCIVVCFRSLKGQVRTQNKLVLLKAEKLEKQIKQSLRKIRQIIRKLWMFLWYKNSRSLWQIGNAVIKLWCHRGSTYHLFSILFYHTFPLHLSRNCFPHVFAQVIFTTTCYCIYTTIEK